MLYLPAMHCVHCVAEVAAKSTLNVPAIQLVHVLETFLPDPVLYVPF